MESGQPGPRAWRAARPRDLAIVGALVAIGAFAVFDALRGGGEPTASRPATTDRETRTETGPAAEGRTPVAAGGTLFVVGDTNCGLRAFDVTSGAEAELAAVRTTCRLWVAPRGRFLAYGHFREGSTPESEEFRLVDVRDVRTPLVRSDALFGRIAWSTDGRRAAWCDQFRNGYDVTIGRAKTPVFAGCPLAYDPLGRVALARGRHLVVGGETLLSARGPIIAAAFGQDGSVAVEAGRSLERWRNGRREQTRPLPRILTAGLEYGETLGPPPIFSPDTCHALFELRSQVRLVDLGCSTERRDRTFGGTQAAWAPDGRWFVVAGAGGITFFHLFASSAIVSWQVDAQDVAWR